MQCEVIDHYKAPHLERYVERLVEARKKKNLTPEGARDLLHDSNYFGTVRPSGHITQRFDVHATFALHCSNS